MLLQINLKFNENAKGRRCCSPNPPLCGYKPKLSLAAMMTLHSNVECKGKSLAPTKLSREFPKSFQSARDFRKI